MGGIMKALKSLVWLFVAMSFLFNQTVLAVPVFQVYIDDAAAARSLFDL